MTNPASQQPAPIPEDLKTDYQDAAGWYHGDYIRGLIERIARLEAALIRLRDCDWVISLPDRMDAVRDIARAALGTPGTAYCPGCHFVNRDHRRDCPARNATPLGTPGREKP